MSGGRRKQGTPQRRRLSDVTTGELSASDQPSRRSSRQRSSTRKKGADSVQSNNPVDCEKLAQSKKNRPSGPDHGPDRGIESNLPPHRTSGEALAATFTCSAKIEEPTTTKTERVIQGMSTINMDEQHIAETTSSNSQQVSVCSNCCCIAQVLERASTVSFGRY